MALAKFSNTAGDADRNNKSWPQAGQFGRKISQQARVQRLSSLRMEWCGIYHHMMQKSSASACEVVLQNPIDHGHLKRW